MSCGPLCMSPSPAAHESRGANDAVGDPCTCRLAKPVLPCGKERRSVATSPGNDHRGRVSVACKLKWTPCGATRSAVAPDCDRLCSTSSRTSTIALIRDPQTNVGATSAVRVAAGWREGVHPLARLGGIGLTTQTDGRVALPPPPTRSVATAGLTACCCAFARMRRSDFFPIFFPDPLHRRHFLSGHTRTCAPDTICACLPAGKARTRAVSSRPSVVVSRCRRCGCRRGRVACRWWRGEAHRYERASR